MSLKVTWLFAAVVCGSPVMAEPMSALPNGVYRGVQKTVKADGSSELVTNVCTVSEGKVMVCVVNGGEASNATFEFHKDGRCSIGSLYDTGHELDNLAGTCFDGVVALSRTDLQAGLIARKDTTTETFSGDSLTLRSLVELFDRDVAGALTIETFVITSDLIRSSK